MIDWTKPLRTKSEEKVLHVYDTGIDHPFHVCAIIAEKERIGAYALWYTREGHTVRGGSALENVPETKTGYLNIYPDQIPHFHVTRQDADRAANCNRIKCVELTWEQ